MRTRTFQWSCENVALRRVAARQPVSRSRSVRERLKRGLACNLFLGLVMLFGLMDAGFAQAPSFSWATKGGGPNQDYGRGLAIDGMGNTYVAGNFYQSATFGNITLTGDSVDQLAFVAK